MEEILATEAVANPLREGGYPIGYFQDTPDTPEGFARFFSAIARDPKTGVPLQLTEHGWRWTEFVYDCHEDNVSAIIEAFREAGKSVWASIFTAWRIGHNPASTNMIIRGGFNAAQDTGATIARVLSENKNWGLFFPHVVPDKTTAWSALNGYAVRDKRMTDGRWAQMLSARGPSKSLMVFPYTSGNIVGRRVSGILLVDDIHQDDNVTSPSELDRVIRIWNGTISYVVQPGAWRMLIGTPWDPADLLQQLKETSGYRFVKTPVIKPDGVPEWPDVWPIERIEQKKNEDLSGGPEFARQMLLDLSASVSRHFSYILFPEDAVTSLWKRRSGLDYASIEGARGNLKWRSHCALANVAQNPHTGDWVISEGYVGQVPQSTVEEWVMSNQDAYPHHEYTVIEMDGKGAEFFAIVARNNKMRIVPENTKGISKPKRLQQLEPLLRGGRLKVSNARTPFLDTLREFLNTYPNINVRHPGWDCADAVYWSAFHLMQQPAKGQRRVSKANETNPWFRLAAME